MELSIIIPCYNVESSIVRCLDSIFNQVVDYEYEVIAVNDASTDSTLKMLEEYAVKEPKLKIINNIHNSKLTGARTAGMKICKGKYIMHLDSDDYLLENSMSIFFDDIFEDIDVKIFNVRVEKADNGHQKLYSFDEKRLFDLAKSGERKMLFSFLKGACYGKLIKRSLIENLLYYSFNYNVGEDIAFNFEIFNKAKKILYDPTEIYFYSYNQFSIMRGRYDENRLVYKNSWLNHVDIVSQNNNYYKEYFFYIRRLQERYIIGQLLQIMKDPNKEKLYDKWRFFFQDYLFGKKTRKASLYSLCLKIRNVKLSFPFFALIMFNWEPIKERLKKK